MGLARCGTVFPVSAVMGVAVPAAVCRWGLCSCCPGVGRSLEGKPSSYKRMHELLHGQGLRYPTYKQGFDAVYTVEGRASASCQLRELLLLFRYSASTV